MSNLQTRILTAIVLGAAALWLTWVGGLGFTLFSIAIGLAMFYEWTELSATKQTSFSRLFGWAWLILTFILLVLDRSALLTIGALLAGSIVLLVTQWKTGRGWPAAGLFTPVFLQFRFRCFEAMSRSVSQLSAFFCRRMVHRHRSLFQWARSGRTKTGAAFFTKQDMVWGFGRRGCCSCGWYSGCVARCTSRKLGCAIAGIAAVDCFADWRSRRIMGEASVRCKGFWPPSAGHGGVLDRVDGLVAAAALLYIFGAIIAEPDVPSAIFFSF